MMNASFPDLRGEHRTEPVPPEPDRLVADIDATFEQQIFDLPQRQRIADLYHHREADYLGRAVEVTEWIAHCRRLRILATSLKPIYSDNARFSYSSLDRSLRSLYCRSDGVRRLGAAV